MQENRLISTIESLKSFGQYTAIAALAKDLKDAHDFAIEVLKDSPIKEIEPRFVIDDKKEIKEESRKQDGLEKFPDYSQNWTLAEKFLYILKREDRFLHLREVAQLIRKLEGNKPSYDEDLKLSRKLSSANAFRKLKDSGALVNIIHDKNIKKSYWGSKKWIDSNGNIIPQHKYSLAIFNNKDSKNKVKSEKDLFDI